MQPGSCRLNRGPGKPCPAYNIRPRARCVTECGETVITPGIAPVLQRISRRSLSSGSTRRWNRFAHNDLPQTGSYGISRIEFRVRNGSATLHFLRGCEALLNDARLERAKLILDALHDHGCVCAPETERIRQRDIDLA